MIWGGTQKYILANVLKIVATPVDYQSQNGLVKCTWISPLELSYSYLTEIKIPREYWYYNIFHSVRMLNTFPGKISHRLTTPHELIYGEKSDKRTWFLLFSIGYFHHQTYSAVTRSSPIPKPSWALQ